MPYYESVFIVRQDMSPTQVEAMADSYAELLGKYEGSVVKREMWGLRNLAFRMNKNRKGHFVMMHLDTPPAGIVEMERLMRISEDVLRYMTIRIEEIPEGPSPMLQQRERGERGDRGERGERGPREGGERGPREGGERGERGERGPREDRGSRDDRGPREDRAPRSESADARTETTAEGAE